MFLICIWESVSFPKQLFSRTSPNSRHSIYNLIQNFAQTKIPLYVKHLKECVVSENSCSKSFINFQEKHPSEIAFLNKVAGYLTLTGNVILGNLWNFQNRFHKKHPWMPASAISCCLKMFRPKDIFWKISHSIWYSIACASWD